MKRQNKIIKPFVVILLLLFAFSFLGNDEVTAAPAYERTNVESQMMIGQKEIYSSFSWKLDGKSYRYEVEADSVVTSSDETIVKTEVIYSQGSSLSTSFYCVNVYALAEGTATIGFTYKEERIEFDIQVMSNQSAVIENFPTASTINKGSFMKLETHYNVTCGSFAGSFWMEDCTVVSDNPAVVSVATEGIDFKTIKLMVNAAGTANIEYEIYRSKSKNKGYVRVGSVSLEKIPFYNYYAHGYKLVNKLSKFKSKETNKFVGS